MSQRLNIIGVQEAAELLNVSPATLKRQALAGTISTVTKLPGRTGAYLFNRDDLIAATETSAA